MERLAFGFVTPLLPFVVSKSPGLVYTRIGLASAVASHFVYDVIVLQAYQRLRKTRAIADKP